MKLHLVWLSCKDWGALGEKVAWLGEAWSDVKRDLQQYFGNHAISLGSIIDAFRKISLTIDPNLHFGYYPEKDVLAFNLWSMFFSLTDDKFVLPTPPWQTGGMLIHEFDHRLFLKEAGLIGKTEKKCDEFEREHSRELEKRAYSNQIAFLENCKRNVPPETTSCKLTISEWSSDGKHIDGNIRFLRASKKGEIQSIDKAICQHQDVLRRIEAGEDYDDFSTKDSLEDHLKIVGLLSLPISLDPNKKDYPRIEMKM